MGVSVEKMSGRNGMVGGVAGKSCNNNNWNPQEFGSGTCTKVTHFTGKKRLPLNFATVSKLWEPAIIQFSQLIFSVTSLTKSFRSFAVFSSSHSPIPSDLKCSSVLLLSPFKYVGICLTSDLKKPLPSLMTSSNSRLKPYRCQ